MFQFIWPCSFREEFFLEISQSEAIIAVAAISVNGSGGNEQSL
jgi:hypothetical protein